MKWASPCAPVEVQVLGQERADDQAAAVVHPAAGEQLAHRRVDDREAGAALAPGVEAAPRRRPTRARRTRAGGRGARCPGGSAARARRSRARRAGARTRPRRRRRARGRAARARARRRSRSAGEGESSRCRPRAGRGARGSARARRAATPQPLAPGALARRDRVARLRLGRRGQAAGGDAGGEGELPRRAVDVAARHLLPGAVEGREHASAGGRPWCAPGRCRRRRGRAGGAPRRRRAPPRPARSRAIANGETSEAK